MLMWVGRDRNNKIWPKTFDPTFQCDFRITQLCCDWFLAQFVLKRNYKFPYNLLNLQHFLNKKETQIVSKLYKFCNFFFCTLCFMIKMMMSKSANEIHTHRQWSFFFRQTPVCLPLILLDIHINHHVLREGVNKKGPFSSLLILGGWVSGYVK